MSASSNFSARLLYLLLFGVFSVAVACASGESSKTGSSSSSGTGASGATGGGGTGGGTTSSGTGGSEPLTDDDNDGYLSDVDCDDANPDVNPGVPELCDGIDNDCDNVVDEPDADDASTWYEDKDEDGFGISGVTTTACEQPDGFAPEFGDCNDDNPSFHPGAPETDCSDPNDYNCDGSTGYTDADGDSFAACEECDDSNDTVYPGAPELCDGLDNDCNGAKDAPGGELDQDNDGAWSCADCDDNDGDNFPGNAEVCDGQDNDCNGLADAPGGEVDADNDGSWSCADCNDNNPNNYPGNTEICDGQDNNCASGADFPGETIDADNDGSKSCADCDDNDPNNFPGNPEICDGQDNNCVNGANFPGETTDADNDNFLACADCDDTNPNVHPGQQEVCDGIDNNCIGGIDTIEVPLSTLCPSGPNVATRECDGANGCKINTCSGNYVNTDGIYSNGCECLASPPVADGANCGSAIVLASLTDASAQTITVSGNTPTVNRSVWYVFNGVDDVDTNGDEYHVDGRFTVNPGNGYRMDVFRGSCGGTQLATNESVAWDWYTDQNRTTVGCSVSSPCGEGNCKSTNQANFNICNSDTSSYYVRVYRTGGAAYCGSYTIAFSNGVY